MFTGIIQHLGRVESIQPNAFGARLVIDPQQWDHHPAAGQSIAVNGCCLTVTDASTRGLLAFDIIRQTLDLTTLGELKPGDQVNLEHAVTPATLLGGHIVQGHVDAVGRVIRVVKSDQEWRVRIELDPDLMHFIMPQGSIAVDGVSLTIAGVGQDDSGGGGDWFEVALIPTTLRLTTLGSLTEGRRVNLETDCLAKMVITWLQQQRGRP